MTRNIEHLEIEIAGDKYDALTDGEFITIPKVLWDRVAASRSEETEGSGA